MDTGACSKCGREMIIETQSILRVRPPSLLRRGGIVMQIIVSCPQRKGFLGALRQGHDKKALTEEHDDD